ncbi:MAG: helix-turn-helix domain-containing protein [Firmicutes bacterium]|nr:helix-turn-helix domain-containing protein [Bacillota bacterium]
MVSKFAERIKELRNEKKLSQRYMASALGIKLSSYQKYEKGGEPTHENLIKIAKFFGVSTDYLLGIVDI